MGGGTVRETFLYQKIILFASKKLILVGILEKCVFLILPIPKPFSTCGVGYGSLWAAVLWIKWSQVTRIRKIECNKIECNNRSGEPPIQAILKENIQYSFFPNQVTEIYFPCNLNVKRTNKIMHNSKPKELL
ncbi:hypothetical protein LEP1GSC137_2797 [Leptospira borgpetersenii str. Noumea 25]|uniref:Uncharacterized protein n=1 Tax=Leptospira borgpetersenii serovar Ballum TaxID=280505 RepID=A0A0E3B620_LEPBO|nr:hypothetical protein LBBP_03445 [Leptospira borgpetersenii serovar Ballum]EKQ99707.1 hypothetical protein LEP1GSC121_1868 [Leptospira borgpetersenii serovar Castellonis str. 200801910]EMO09132.1 hypothetical protein LEP1GSC137_2797 [Leptospira borgpetersenii str. Noumea 25]KGE25631.1 hypothetical protein IQ66_03485 [Leptospira borgpetersenii serovar Ballum]OOV46355.1 hypothetical protein B1H38_00755 [Leptospira borgpetersenii serovar Ballum]